jgi:proteasome beta subunit
LFDLRDDDTSDFLETLRRKRPDLLTQCVKSSCHPLGFDRGILPTQTPQVTPPSNLSGQNVANLTVNGLLEGTTVLAAVYKDGLVIAGDRQAVEGFQVGERRIEKIFEIDEYSAVAIAGVAATGIEMAKLFQVQVEYYEKMEGTMLSLEGKANYLANMVRQNLGMALQGLVVVPIFTGYDQKREQGRIFKYDPIGGRYEEEDYYAIGSGGKDARATLKKRYRPGMSRDEILNITVEALWDAADEDLGTGGPDFIREIFPNIKVIDQSGVSDVPDSDVQTLFTELAERLSSLNLGR